MRQGLHTCLYCCYDSYCKGTNFFSIVYRLATVFGLASVHSPHRVCRVRRYFGELVKVETGRTAKDIIADQLLVAAKELLSNEVLSVAQVSERIGFDYPQHFVRFFKARTGKTPSQFRQI